MPKRLRERAPADLGWLDFRDGVLISSMVLVLLVCGQGQMTLFERPGRDGQNHVSESQL